MGARNVVGTVHLPGTVAPSEASVKVELVASDYAQAAGYPGNGESVMGPLEPTVSASGVWTAALEDNDNITPADTYYKVTTKVPGWPSVVELISVPAGSGDLNVPDILVASPSSPSGVTTNHGALTGLSDDDHSQYAFRNQRLGNVAPSALAGCYPEHTTRATMTPTLGRLYVVPIRPPVAQTIAGLGLEVTTSHATSVAELGIYKQDTPNSGAVNRIADFGRATLSSTGHRAADDPSSTVVASDDQSFWYLAVLFHTAASAAVRSVKDPPFANVSAGVSTVIGANTPIGYYEDLGVATDLPATITVDGVVYEAPLFVATGSV